MNGFVVLFNRWIVFSVCVLACVGCKQDSERKTVPPDRPVTAGQTAPAFRTDYDGETILRDLRARYATAKSYRDNAVLDLSYQLEGRNIQEPQRWATTWANSGKLSAKYFNGSIQGDGQLLSCYIFDIETANLDGQHLLIPYDQQLPLNQLFRDSIAKHFLGGYSELPLDETDMVAAPKLVSPVISLLTNQLPNGWLQNPERVERLSDESINGKECYVVRCLSQGMTSDVWIDAESTTLVQMSLPLKLLVGEVITSPEISDVVLMARFEGAELDGEIADTEFALQPRANSTPVRKFVALPETFPSELIGETAPKFNLISEDGKPANRLEFDGKITTLLWLAGRQSYSALAKLDTLAAKLPADKFRFGAVYSDADLKSPGTGSTEVVDELAAATSVSNVSVFYDFQLAASTSLRIKVVPSVIVLDGDSKIQFTQSLDRKNWLEDVNAAVQRIAKGDDVAGEMQSDYQRYLESYRQQLLTVSAADLLDSADIDSSSRVVSSSPPGSRQGQNIRLGPKKIWANSEFKQAGNLAVLPMPGKPPNENQGGLLAFDGWRTIVELDATGETRSRLELDLPEGTAVNRIRIGTDSAGERLFAVFSTLGDKVYLFDHNWKRLGMYPEITPQVPSNGSTGPGVRDCQLTDLNSDGQSELIVAFGDDRGIVLANPSSHVGPGEQISTLRASSLDSYLDDLVVSSEGKIGMLKTGWKNVEETELEFKRVATNGADQLCGLGVTSGGKWNAVGFDGELKRIWTLSIGSQFFETEIEPIAAARTTTGESIWAIADTENAIHLVSGSGKWLGDFQSESQLSGVALTTTGQGTLLMVSNQRGVECWNLNCNANPIRPVSTAK